MTLIHLSWVRPFCCKHMTHSLPPLIFRQTLSCMLTESLWQTQHSALPFATLISLTCLPLAHPSQELVGPLRAEILHLVVLEPSTEAGVDNVLEKYLMFKE